MGPHSYAHTHVFTHTFNNMTTLFLTKNPNWKTVNVKNIDVGDFIGAGAQGRVFKASYANERLALKKIQINTKQHQIELERELQILANLDHQNIIKFHGAGIFDR